MAFNTAQEPYESLRSIIAERTNKLTIWCGAGLSVPAGLPTWGELRRKLETALLNKANTLDGNDRKKLTTTLKDIQGETNYWVAFQRLEDSLRPTSFQTIVRESFLPAASATNLNLYEKVWRMNISGMLNLNLDRLANQAFYRAFPEREGRIPDFHSSSVGSYAHVLKSPKPFIYNVHGIESDASTWVFTHDKLRQLFSNQAYMAFVTTVLMNSTVLFLGLSAEDIAVGSHLRRLADHSLDSGPHYWITSKRDATTDSWAESMGIRIVRYRAKGRDHSELEEALDGILKFVPPDDLDEEPRPAFFSNSSNSNGSDILPVAELIRFPAEEIRAQLNAKALEILRPRDETSINLYEQFTEEYDEAIDRAWYVSTASGRNGLLGYTLQERVAKGAFGDVYKAIDADGNQVGIKILLRDIRAETAILQSFRRGVASMQILSRNSVKGMVAYREASEIPAFVVMDWIDGPNLEAAVAAGLLSDWISLLNAAFQIAEIIYSAHSLPERVLHRDIRPANIMLQDYWTSASLKLVVLDFDLSWHRGAYEKSVVWGSTAAGYLAPEQVHRLKGVSTRHSAVDSFGLGMTLYYAISGEVPVPNQHKHRDWNEKVNQACKKMPTSKWVSIPRRFARLILTSTHDSQAQRWDMNQIYTELARLIECVERPESIRSAELIAEEMASRCGQFFEYVWDQERQSAIAQGQLMGVEISLSGNEASRSIELMVQKSAVGVEDRAKVQKNLQSSLGASASILSSHGWKVIDQGVSQGTARMTARIASDTAMSSISQTVAILDRALQQLPKM